MLYQEAQHSRISELFRQIIAASLMSLIVVTMTSGISRAYALRDTEIHVNDRICQFRIMEHQPTIQFEETEKLTGADRGGIGSTGVQ